MNKNNVMQLNFENLWDFSIYFYSTIRLLHSLQLFSLTSVRLVHVRCVVVFIVCIVEGIVHIVVFILCVLGYL